MRGRLSPHTLHSSFLRRQEELHNSEAGHRICISPPRYQSEELSCACGARATFSVWPEKRGPKRGHPAWRLPPIPGRQVRESEPGFSTAHRATAPALPQLGHPCPRPVLAKRNRHRADSRYAACRPRLTAAQGAPGRAARHPGAHSVRQDGAVVEEPSQSLCFEHHSQACECLNSAPLPDIENRGCKPRLPRSGVCFQEGLGAGPRSNRGKF